MSHSLWRLLVFVVVAASACQPEKPAEQVTTPPPVPDSLQTAVAVPALAEFDAVDWMGKGLPEKAATDTTFQIDGKPYHLRLSAKADSTLMLRVVTDGIVGPALAADSN